MSKKLTVVVDTQYDFMSPHGKLYVPGANELVGPICQHLLELEPDTCAGVLFTADTHDAATYPQSEEAKQFPPHCYKGTQGWDNVIPFGVVHPGIPVYGLEKPVFDMWAHVMAPVLVAGGGVIPSLATFAGVLIEDDVYDVEFCGVAEDVCVEYAWRGFSSRGFTTTVLHHLTKPIKTER